MQVYEKTMVPQRFGSYIILPKEVCVTTQAPMQEDIAPI